MSDVSAAYFAGMALICFVIGGMTSFNHDDRGLWLVGIGWILLLASWLV